MTGGQDNSNAVLNSEAVLYVVARSHRRYWELGASCAIFVLLLIVWQAGVTLGTISPLLLPPPLAVGTRIVEDLGDAIFFRALISTGIAMLEGFVAGSLVGIVLGAVLATWPSLERIFHPYFVAFQTFPKVALAPLLSVWLGYEQTPKIVLAAILAFFPVMVNSLVGFRATRAEELELLEAMDASGFQTFHKVRLMNALDYIFAGVEMALIFALLGTITAEVLGSKEGLGHLLIVRMSNMDVTGVFSLLAMFAILGTGCYMIGSFIHKRTVFW